MMWIFEWDILGASSAALSNIYHICRDNFQAVIDEGFEAVKGAIALKDLLLESRDLVETRSADYEALIAAVEYEIELFRLLDYYRQFFMHYYRWIDTGDAQSAVSYKLAMGQFTAMMDFHETKYGGNLQVLGMDFMEAKTGISLAEESPSSIRWAKVEVVLFLFLLVLGVPGAVRDRANKRFAGTLLFDSIFRPYQVSAQNAYHGTGRLAFFLLALYLLSLAIFSAFTSMLFPICMGGLGLIFVGILALLIRKGKNMAKILVSLLASKILFFSLFVMLLFRKFQVYAILCRKWRGEIGPASGALVYAILGFQLLLAGLALWIFGLEYSLTALNNEMLVIPAGLSKIMGITTHLGIPLQLPLWMVSFSAGLILVSFLWYFVARRRSF